MSNAVRGLFQPIFKQTCWTSMHQKKSIRIKKSSCYFGDFNINGVTSSASIRICIASIRNQLDVEREKEINDSQDTIGVWNLNKHLKQTNLRIPYTKIVLSVSSLWENCDCGSIKWMNRDRNWVSIFSSNLYLCVHYSYVKSITSTTTTIIVVVVILFVCWLMMYWCIK